MAQDIFGPGAHGAARPAAVRPAHTPGTGATDTWCEDCTSPTARDGTEWRAAHMNALIAQMRRMVRGNAITESTADDDMLFRAGRSQRGNWLTVGGTANDLTLAPSPAFAALSDLVGVPLRCLTGGAANTGAMTLVVSALAAKAITWPDGTALVAGDLPAASTVEVIYDGTAYRLQYCLSPTQVRALISADASIPGRTQIFTASGNFTVPTGVTQVEVVVIGGGGGGGASNNSTAGGTQLGNCGAGGGGGGYAYKRISGLSSGGVVAVTVGAGGTAAANSAGGAGGSSSFGAHCSATGGGAGAFGSSTIGAGGAGGAGSGGDINVTGGNGGSTGTNNAGTPTQSEILNIFNKGGVAAGGFATAAFGGTGAAGRGFGCGGSGASGGSGLSGGAGAGGVVIVRW